MSTARKLDPVRIPDDQRLPDDIIEVDEQGAEVIVIRPEDEESFDQMTAEAEEDERLGRLVPVEEIRAKLRCSP